MPTIFLGRATQLAQVVVMWDRRLSSPPILEDVKGRSESHGSTANIGLYLRGEDSPVKVEIVAGKRREVTKVVIGDRVLLPVDLRTIAEVFPFELAVVDDDSGVLSVRALPPWMNFAPEADGRLTTHGAAVDRWIQWLWDNHWDQDRKLVKDGIGGPMVHQFTTQFQQEIGVPPKERDGNLGQGTRAVLTEYRTRYPHTFKPHPDELVMEPDEQTFFVGPEPNDTGIWNRAAAIRAHAFVLDAA